MSASATHSNTFTNQGVFFNIRMCYTKHITYVYFFMSKTSSILIACVVIVIVAGGGYLLYTKSNNVPSASPSITITAPNVSVVAEPVKQPTATAPDPAPAPQAAVITYTDAGFAPETLTVSAGTKVVFTDNSSNNFWPASNVHPTHTEYPGSDIEKCGTAAASTIFDACGGVAPGGSFSFTFNNKGAWRYHDHLDAGFGGTVVVQ